MTKENLEVERYDVRETYTFQYSKQELSEITNLNFKEYRNDVLRGIIISVLLAIPINLPKPSVFTVITAIILIVVFNFKRVKNYISSRKQYKKSEEIASQSTYVYELYDNFLTLKVFRNEENVRNCKVDYCNLQVVKDLGNYFVLQLINGTFIFRKKELKQDSLLYSIYWDYEMNPRYQKMAPLKGIRQGATGWWGAVSWILCIASYLSIYGALFAEGLLIEKNGLFTENMWVFFLFVPIPVASIIVGVLLKKRGFKYLKNIIAGIIMTILLCLYGSMSFIQTDMYEHDESVLIYVEEKIGIDIPEPEKVNTGDFTQGTQTGGNGYVYYRSEVYFEEDEVQQFEKEIIKSDKWMSKVPTELVGIISSWSFYETYDYIMIYNIDTGEYNTLPAEEGTYRFMAIGYMCEDSKMEIVEYEIDFVK